jgi:hypothetical protein
MCNLKHYAGNPALLMILLMLCLTNCSRNNHVSNKVFSPSGKYYLITTVNRTDQSKADYADVIISVYNIDGKLKTKFSSNAGDANSWAIGWDAVNDTVVMFSSDIGIFAWRLENDEPVSIELTNPIESRAKQLKAEKYK